jgi:single-stranded-DNA-specific exonuclease
VNAHDRTALAAARDALLAADHVAPHGDADGLASGALALLARGEDASRACLLDRTRTPWGPDPDLPDGRIALLDQGVREFARPGVLIDHHVPEVGLHEAGDDVVVLTAFGERPETSTAPLVLRALGEGPAWVAAVGAVGDLGEAGFRLPECAGAQRGAVKRLVPLINAPRRLAAGPVRTALALLVDHDSPIDALNDPRIRILERARQEWRAAFERAVRTAPRFHGDVAVLRFCVPYQVHPLVATAWARKLSPRPVLVANDGWVPGRVNFAVRGGNGADLRALLRRALTDPDGDLGNGHPRATGGSLPPHEFDRLLAGLTAQAGMGDDELRTAAAA